MNEIQGKLEQNEVNNSSTAHLWGFYTYLISLCAFQFSVPFWAYFLYLAKVYRDQNTQSLSE